MDASSPKTGHSDGSENTIRDSAVTQTNPAEIRHVAFTEGIQDILYRKYTHLATFTLSPTMLAGTIFGIIPNHPFACSQSIRHIAQLFGAWTGEMHIRARFATNFLAGGSIRIGQFPPTMTEKQIRSLSLAELTFHPNVDFDPKDTSWIEQKAVDSRRIMYHNMQELDTSNPDTFGGWIVFYVVAPLVSNMNQEGTIQLVVEARGQYDFAEPRILPHAGPTPVDEGPLPVHVLRDILDQPGCDDTMTTPHDSSLVISPNINLPTGFAFASGFNAASPWSLGKGAASDYTRLVRSAYLDGNSLTITPACSGQLYSDGSGSTERWAFYVETPTTHTLPPNCRKDLLQINTKRVEHNPGVVVLENSVDATYKKEFLAPTTITFYTEHQSGTVVPIPSDESQGVYGYIRVQKGSFGLPWQNADVNKYIFGPANSNYISPMVNEAVVTFYNTAYHTINMQTKTQADALRVVKGLDETKSYVYQLRKASNDSILMYMRLSPNGMWTTNNVRVTSIITYGDYYLKFFGIYALDQPLPSPSTQRNVMYKTAKYAALPSESVRMSKFTAFLSLLITFVFNGEDPEEERPLIVVPPKDGELAPPIVMNAPKYARPDAIPFVSGGTLQEVQQQLESDPDFLVKHAPAPIQEIDTHAVPPPPVEEVAGQQTRAGLGFNVAESLLSQSQSTGEFARRFQSSIPPIINPYVMPPSVSREEQIRRADQVAPLLGNRPPPESVPAAIRSSILPPPVTTNGFIPPEDLPPRGRVTGFGFKDPSSERLGPAISDYFQQADKSQGMQSARPRNLGLGAESMLPRVANTFAHAIGYGATNTLVNAGISGITNGISNLMKPKEVKPKYEHYGFAATPIRAHNSSQMF